MKRAIRFTAITALILGISGFRPAEAGNARNHGPRITVEIAKPGLAQKAHHRKFSRGRGYRVNRGRGYRVNRGRGHRFSRGRSYRRHYRGYHRHYYRLFSGVVATRWHWHQ